MSYLGESLIGAKTGGGFKMKLRHSLPEKGKALVAQYVKERANIAIINYASEGNAVEKGVLLSVIRSIPTDTKLEIVELAEEITLKNPEEHEVKLNDLKYQEISNCTSSRKADYILVESENSSDKEFIKNLLNTQETPLIFTVINSNLYLTTVQIAKSFVSELDLDKSNTSTLFIVSQTTDNSAYQYYHYDKASAVMTDLNRDEILGWQS